ncbi:hypothetical protein PoB_006593100 [Plakobranchus ocellatus]|uniref:Uncharacterized protein n=1 Tax=Plakobranchus ocellatus TaxID=259542 RepID=A0AAV4D5S1_9GAST|nr:hypothetical protein PoB_006593100 [Plakobranchus ocellatus]
MLWLIFFTPTVKIFFNASSDIAGDRYNQQVVGYMDNKRPNQTSMPGGQTPKIAKQDEHLATQDHASAQPGSLYTWPHLSTHTLYQPQPYMQQAYNLSCLQTAAPYVQNTSYSTPQQLPGFDRMPVPENNVPNMMHLAFMKENVHNQNCNKRDGQDVQQNGVITTEASGQMLSNAGNGNISYPDHKMIQSAEPQEGNISGGSFYQNFNKKLALAYRGILNYILSLFYRCSICLIPMNVFDRHMSDLIDRYDRRLLYDSVNFKRLVDKLMVDLENLHSTNAPGIPRQVNQFSGSCQPQRQGGRSDKDESPIDFVKWGNFSTVRDQFGRPLESFLNNGSNSNDESLYWTRYFKASALGLCTKIKHIINPPQTTSVIYQNTHSVNNFQEHHPGLEASRPSSRPLLNGLAWNSHRLNENASIIHPISNDVSHKAVDVLQKSSKPSNEIENVNIQMKRSFSNLSDTSSYSIHASDSFSNRIIHHSAAYESKDLPEFTVGHSAEQSVAQNCNKVSPPNTSFGDSFAYVIKWMNSLDDGEAEVEESEFSEKFTKNTSKGGAQGHEQQTFRTGINFNDTAQLTWNMPVAASVGTDKSKLTLQISGENTNDSNQQTQNIHEKAPVLCRESITLGNCRCNSYGDFNRGYNNSSEDIVEIQQSTTGFHKVTFNHKTGYKIFFERSPEGYVDVFIRQPLGHIDIICTEPSGKLHVFCKPPFEKFQDFCKEHPSTLNVAHKSFLESYACRISGSPELSN